MARLTMDRVRKELTLMGMTIKSIPDCGEYRVNFANREVIGEHVFGGEATAYYATSLDDALATATAMFSRAEKVRMA